MPTARIASCTFMLAVICAIEIGTLLTCGHVASAWPSDPKQSVAICTEKQEQVDLVATSEGHGGAIIAWSDKRSYENCFWRDDVYECSRTDIYAQRVDRRGQVLWTMDGVPICTEDGDQIRPVIVGDGSGGAIIAWLHRPDWLKEERDARKAIYAQRVDTSGAIQWAHNGVRVWDTTGAPHSLSAVTDGASGTILVCQETSWDEEIVLARVDSTGAVRWVRFVERAMSINAAEPAIVGDGSGGVIVVWRDSVDTAPGDIRAQRFDALGTRKWTEGGVVVCAAWEDQSSPSAASDGKGGAIIAWEDQRAGTFKDSNIYAQRVDANARMLWKANGVPICMASDDQYNPKVTSDAVGGAVISWCDVRGKSVETFLQLVDSAGAVKWRVNGVPVAQVGKRICTGSIIAIGTTGFIVTWHDSRAGEFKADVYAQRFNLVGQPQWTANGIAVSTGKSNQWSPIIVPTGYGGAIIAWEDERDWQTNDTDIYAQAINHLGKLGQVAASATAIFPGIPTELWAESKVGTLVLEPPTLRWSPVPAAYYHLQVDDDPYFLSPEIDEADVKPSSYKLEDLPEGIYYWRVKAVGIQPGSFETGWSETATVTIGGEPATVSILDALSVSFSFDVSQVCGTTSSHELQVSWQVTGGTPPYKIAIEITGPDEVTQLHQTNMLAGQKSFVLRYPAGGSATIAVTAEDASGVNSSSKGTWLPPC